MSTRKLIWGLMIFLIILSPAAGLVNSHPEELPDGIQTLAAFQVDSAEAGKGNCTSNPQTPQQGKACVNHRDPENPGWIEISCHAIKAHDYNEQGHPWTDEIGAKNCGRSTPPTATNTPIVPTATNTPIVPTATNTPIVPTATNTPIVPTATNTPITPIPPISRPVVITPVCVSPDAIYGMVGNVLNVIRMDNDTPLGREYYPINRQGSMPNDKVAIDPYCFMYVAFVDSGSSTSDILKLTITGQFIEKVTNTAEINETDPFVDNLGKTLCYTAGDKVQCRGLNDSTYINARNPVVAPDGETVVYSSTINLTIGGEGEQLLTGTPSPYEVLDWSPNGSEWAVAIATGVGLYNLDTKNYDALLKGAQYASFQPAGNFIVIADDNGALWIKPASNPEEQGVKISDTVDFKYISWFTRNNAEFSMKPYKDITEAAINASDQPAPTVPNPVDPPTFKTTYSGPSVVDFCKSVGIKDCSVEARGVFAVQHGIVSNQADFTGTWQQNSTLLDAMRILIQ